MALFGFDARITEENDPRASVVLTREVGFATDELFQMSRTSRVQLPRKWARFEEQLAQAYEQLALLSGHLFLVSGLDRHQERQALIGDAREALSQYGAWFRALAPEVSRGAPLKRAHDVSVWRSAMVFSILADAGIETRRLIELVSGSAADWSFAPVSRQRLRYLASGRRLRDRIHSLVRQGRRERAAPRPAEKKVPR